MNFNLFGCRFGRCILYQRYLVAIACAFILLNLYVSRRLLHVTIPYLMPRTESNATNITGTCEKHVDQTLQLLGNRIKWSADEKLYIFSAFYVTYILTHIPSGIICDMHGPRHILSFSVVFIGLLTVFTPLVVENYPWWVMLILRLFIGALQGSCITAMFTLVANWAPSHQISFLTSVAYSGGSLGNAVLSGTAIVFFKIMGSWKWLFYFWGGISISCYFFCLCLIFSSPSSHPFVSKQEKDLLEHQLGVGYPKSIPWKRLLSETSVWGILVGQIGHNWILFILSHHLPKYYKDVLGYHLTSNFVMEAVPYIFMFLTAIASGLLGDHLINKRYIPVVYLRTIYTCIGIVFPSIFILIAMYAGCYRIVLLLLFIAALVCKATIFAGLKANILDITRHYVGVVFGIENGLGAITAIITPIIVKYMCPDNTFEQWRKMFWLSFAVCCFTTLLFIIWSKSDRASWDHIDNNEDYRL